MHAQKWTSSLKLVVILAQCRYTKTAQKYLNIVIYNTPVLLWINNGTVWYIHCLKKVPTFKLSVTLSNVNRFSKLLHCWKTYEICYTTHRHYPPYLRYVATLPWEIKNANFLQIFSAYGRKCKQIAFCRLYLCCSSTNFDLSVFKIVSFPPYWLQIKFPMSLFFYLFTSAVMNFRCHKLMAKSWGTCQNCKQFFCLCCCYLFTN